MHCYSFADATVSTPDMMIAMPKRCPACICSSKKNHDPHKTVRNVTLIKGYAKERGKVLNTIVHDNTWQTRAASSPQYQGLMSMPRIPSWALVNPACLAQSAAIVLSKIEQQIKLAAIYLPCLILFMAAFIYLKLKYVKLTFCLADRLVYFDTSKQAQS